LTGAHAKRAVLILALLILGVEGYFTYQWYDRHYGSGPDTASGDVAPLEGTMPDGTAPEETTAKRGFPSDAADTVTDRGVVASRQDEAEYVATVGDMQSEAVETFLESHERLLRYDALAADDVEEMKANEIALQAMAERATNLAPPRKYEEQHDVFGSAIDELRNAAGLAHGMAVDPVASAELGFDGYDGRVDEASSLLRRSNELLGKDYETIEGVREVSPEF
jgi:hypothetical protein